MLGGALFVGAEKGLKVREPTETANPNSLSDNNIVSACIIDRGSRSTARKFVVLLRVLPIRPRQNLHRYLNAESNLVERAAIKPWTDRSGFALVP